MLAAAAEAATQVAPQEQVDLAVVVTAALTQRLPMAPLILAVVAAAVDTLAARLAWLAETAAPVS